MRNHSACSEDFYHSMTSKAKNQKFFKELQSIKRKGITAMIGTDGLRHTTLWNGNNFVDVEMNKEVDIPLFGYDYLNDPLGKYPFVSNFYFWELK